MMQVSFQGSQFAASPKSIKANKLPLRQALPESIKQDKFNSAKLLKQKNEVRFGLFVKANVDLTGVKSSPEVTNKLIDIAPSIDTTAVSIGDTYETTGLKLCSPSLDVSIGGVSKKDIATLASKSDVHRAEQSIISALTERFSALVTKSDLERVQDNILKPLSAQLTKIEEQNSQAQGVYFKKAHANLNMAANTNQVKEFRRYLKAAEQDFLSAKFNPVDYEQGINAQIGYATCLKLLGYEEQSKKEYYSALAGMAESLPVLEEAAERASKSVDTKAAFIHDLMLLQDHLRDEPTIQSNIFRVGRSLDSRAIQKKYLTLPEVWKDLSEIAFTNEDIKDAYLVGANLRNADLQGLNMQNKDLSNAYLAGANLRNANLSGANLSGVTVQSLTRSLGPRANFEGANLSGAIMNDDLKSYIENKEWNKIEILDVVGSFVGWYLNR